MKKRVNSSESYEQSLVIRDLCFIDTETTGSRFGFHEIIEIGAIRTDHTGIVTKGCWEICLRPKHPERITDFAAELTGFTMDRWKDACSNSAKIWKSFSQFASTCIPVCHNPHFDRAFITFAAEEVGVTDLGVDYHWLGTESLAWPLFLRGEVSGIRISTLCDDLGLDPEPEVHKALSGADVCRRLYIALMHMHRVRLEQLA